MHQSNPWTSDWLKGYDKEGIKGLRNRTKSGRPFVISEEISYQIKKELRESNNQGWTTKQVEELIIKKSGIKHHYIHTYTASFVNGALSKRKFQEKYMLILHLWRKKGLSKKDRTDIYGYASAAEARWIFRSIFR